MDADCLSIILNEEVIALSQDPQVSRAKMVHQWPDAVWPNTATTTASTTTTTTKRSVHDIVPRATSGSTTNNQQAVGEVLASPGPQMSRKLALAPCSGAAAANQTFSFDATSGLLRLSGTSQCG